MGQGSAPPSRVVPMQVEDPIVVPGKASTGDKVDEQ